MNIGMFDCRGRSFKRREVCKYFAVLSVFPSTTLTWEYLPVHAYTCESMKTGFRSVCPTA
ncbi:hypothetical protein ACFLX8_01290 [Chloroflexota bacterium]